MHDRKRLFDSALFWVGIAAVAIVIGEVVVSNVHGKSQGLRALHDAGIGLEVLCPLAFLWALILLRPRRSRSVGQCQTLDDRTGDG